MARFLSGSNKEGGNSSVLHFSMGLRSSGFNSVCFLYHAVTATCSLAREKKSAFEPVAFSSPLCNTSDVTHLHAGDKALESQLGPF